MLPDLPKPGQSFRLSWNFDDQYSHPSRILEVYVGIGYDYLSYDFIGGELHGKKTAKFIIVELEPFPDYRELLVEGFCGKRFSIPHSQWAVALKASFRHDGGEPIIIPDAAWYFLPEKTKAMLSFGQRNLLTMRADGRFPASRYLAYDGQTAAEAAVAAIG